MFGEAEQQLSKTTISPFLLLGLLLVLGYYVFFSQSGLLLVRAFVFLIAWWAAVFAFWVLPPFAFFGAERRWIETFSASQTSPLAKSVVIGVFRLLYWPIFLPRTATFLALCFLVAAWYIAKA